ncbi:hypothetical protein CBR_g16832 [Chara braunii]|uniref:Reverse transcriptase domain-containing protein n=1 Tax=Chara braunii TaxID=69332 RepID=A0A388KTV9_CHABU|nr:hypothetical protein CBR_g16832 [Chara braunii]|eukprot:GBG73491.1 hypothetical protein CBR_g16832 [Chara braunii]
MDGGKRGRAGGGGRVGGGRDMNGKEGEDTRKGRRRGGMEDEEVRGGGGDKEDEEGQEEEDEQKEDESEETERRREEETWRMRKGRKSKSTLDQILDVLTRPGYRLPAQSPLPLSAMSGHFPVQAGTQPSGTSAAASQTVASSSSGPAVIATSPQQPVQQSGQTQGQWYPKTPMKPPLAFSGERKDEELNTWLRTVPVWVKAKRTLPEDEVVTDASYLEGKAAKWLDGVVVKARYGRRMADWAKSLTLDQFMEMVEARWHNPQKAQKATDAINKLDQRKFSLCNAPGTFQHAMNRIFHDHLDKFVVVYLDDILIFSKSAEEHAQHVETVLSLLRQHKYKVNLEKCEFGRTKILYLGQEVSAEGIRPEDAKVASIRDWPRPQTVTEVRSFLGMCGYYRNFVKNYSTIASPLTDLTRLDTPWDWSDECEGAFKRLKHALMNHEVLMVPDPQKPFIVTTDANQYGIGAVLAQQDGKKLKPIEYMTKKMPSKKLAKSTYERELYALYKALVHWRHFLLGRFFYLRTDHQTLKWIKTQPALSDALKKSKPPSYLKRKEKEAKELIRQAKKLALLEEQAAKRKKLEEEMERLKKEDEEKMKAVDEEEIEEEKEEESLIRRSTREKGESSGTKKESWIEKKVFERVANLSLGEEEDVMLYVPREEQEAVVKELEAEEDPLRCQTIEEEKNLQWKLRLTREKKRRMNEPQEGVDGTRACRKADHGKIWAWNSQFDSDV